ncbi:uncharacterized protein PADG_00842 [Paracoccidioides brasiliensis Pb18]|uniref:Phosphatidate cytidylyltransferase, mitochondrial n=1 Tax=Paracoccidioides brasiliensis (strain Pb18) TaxID=502780 RepID=C1FYG6_PARBD|nr:uncharacterized protein PADG_00842 [Paracoccidioides brasiliensis Pb18]EEH44553.1 hypothetical protein PADG_00842 [Paracoccidioides brasiliensis Pb18]
MSISHRPLLLVRPRLVSPSHLRIFIPAVPSCSSRNPKNYCFLSTESSSTPHQDGGPPPSFNASVPHKNPNIPSISSLDVSSSGSSTPSSTSTTNWYDNPDFTISTFSELPSKNFGVNQHMIIDEEFKEALRQILWQFKAPIRYAFAYGSGVFPQSNRSAAPAGSSHPAPPQAIQTGQNNSGKMIDFIFGVSYSQHWHSLNLNEHRDHYSGLGSLGSYVVSQVQEKWGAGVYFNPYVTVNGTLIKYGVVNIDTLCKDLSDWDTLYLAGRLHKPVKILRDHPKVRLANQMNLLSAVRVALLLLPPNFTEHQLYSTIAGISYRGDPRMSFATEDPRKVNNIVSSQMGNFRRLYASLIEALPNVAFNDPQCSDPDWVDNPEINAGLAQDMDPFKRGNMVRRLPQSFREKLFFQFQSRFQIPGAEFDKMMQESNDEDPDRVRHRVGGKFEQKIAADEFLPDEVNKSIKKTISWPSTSQSIKSLFTAGVGRGWRYLREKQGKHASAKREHEEDASHPDKKE